MEAGLTGVASLGRRLSLTRARTAILFSAILFSSPSYGVCRCSPSSSISPRPLPSATKCLQWGGGGTGKARGSACMRKEAPKRDAFAVVRTFVLLSLLSSNDSIPSQTPSYAWRGRDNQTPVRQNGCCSYWNCTCTNRRAGLGPGLA